MGKGSVWANARRTKGDRFIGLKASGRNLETVAMRCMSCGARKICHGPHQRVSGNCRREASWCLVVRGARACELTLVLAGIHVVLATCGRGVEVGWTRGSAES